MPRGPRPLGIDKSGGGVSGEIRMKPSSLFHPCLRGGGSIMQRRWGGGLGGVVVQDEDVAVGLRDTGVLSEHYRVVVVPVGGGAY